MLLLMHYPKSMFLLSHFRLKCLVFNYVDDEQFGPIMAKAVDGIAIEGVLSSGWVLYKEGKLCIPNGLVWELLVREAHAGGLSGYLGEKKTFKLVTKHFYC